MALLAALLPAACWNAPPGPRIEVWHGAHQKVGHLGDAQDDFNLMGSVTGGTLSCSLNGGPPVSLTVAEGRFGFRRLARAGHFNADIPIRLLRPGMNEVTLSATGPDDGVSTEVVTIEKLTGSSPLPYSIRWSEIRDPQDAGQYVDGHWKLTADGLRTVHTGYDRIFLIGERSWRDYQATAKITIHQVEPETSPISGGNGVGLIARFAGHAAGGHREFPEAQPKWGYQPFGAIGWLRWKKNAPEEPPQEQFYRGDNDRRSDHGAFPVELGRGYLMKMACQTLPDDPSGAGVTRYSFKIWPADEAEPRAWDWRETQTSAHALRRGGLALLAHHVDATFGDITIEPIQ